LLIVWKWLTFFPSWQTAQVKETPRQKAAALSKINPRRM
jgi:hypothetical protein